LRDTAKLLELAINGNHDANINDILDAGGVPHILSYGTWTKVGVGLRLILWFVLLVV